MRSALCALALILLLPNAVAAEDMESATFEASAVCDPVNVDDEPPYVEVYEECLPKETSAESK